MVVYARSDVAQYFEELDPTGRKIAASGKIQLYARPVYISDNDEEPPKTEALIAISNNRETTPDNDPYKSKYPDFTEREIMWRTGNSDEPNGDNINGVPNTAKDNSWFTFNMSNWGKTNPSQWDIEFAGFLGENRENKNVILRTIRMKLYDLWHSNRMIVWLDDNKKPLVGVRVYIGRQPKDQIASDD